MGEETKQLRRLVIKAYHIREAMWGEEQGGGKRRADCG